MKNIYTQLLALSITIFIFSCSKENNIKLEKEIIEIYTTDFKRTIDENPKNGKSLGFVKASTNKWQITYSLVEQNPEGALTINQTTGELFIRENSLFNYEAHQKITAVVQVSNRDVSQELNVTIIINDLRENVPFDIIAGTGVSGLSGDGALALNAQLNYPRQMVFDKTGNLIFTEEKNNTVRKIDQNGIITTIAGTGVADYSGDGGLANSAQLNAPWGITIDKEGNILIADSGNHVIRKIDLEGKISTLAGTGVAGFSGDEGMAYDAKLRNPRGIHVDEQNNVYIADTDNFRVRKIDNQGVITTIAGNGENYWSGYGDGDQATDITFQAPNCITSKDGNLYVFDQTSGVIRKINTDGTITTIGNKEENLIYIINAGTSMNFDNNGNLFISNLDGNFYRVDIEENLSPVHILNELGFIGGFTFDKDFNFIYSDTYRHLIKKIDRTYLPH